MEYSALECIEVMSQSELFNERENEKTHTTYETEKMFFSAITKGSRSSVKYMMNQIFKQKIITGKMSDDPIRQMKYWAVSTVTLATRYAIQGGLDETTAMNFSDNCIHQIDMLNNNDKILILLGQRALELADMVAESRENSVYPYPIKECLHYINTHLHEDLSLPILAKVCHLSVDYLGYLFKKNTGISLAKYIKKQKLFESKEMIRENYSISEIAYYLGFCSESYFISCFKKEFGKTPKDFKNNMNL